LFSTCPVNTEQVLNIYKTNTEHKKVLHRKNTGCKTATEREKELTHTRMTQKGQREETNIAHKKTGILHIKSSKHG